MPIWFMDCYFLPYNQNPIKIQFWGRIVSHMDGFQIIPSHVLKGLFINIFNTLYSVSQLCSSALFAVLQTVAYNDGRYYS